MYGCNSIGLAPKIDKDGKVQDTRWFDEGRLEIIDDKGIAREEVMVEKKGAGENQPINYSQ